MMLKSSEDCSKWSGRHIAVGKKDNSGGALNYLDVVSAHLFSFSPIRTVRWLARTISAFLLLQSVFIRTDGHRLVCSPEVHAEKHGRAEERLEVHVWVGERALEKQTLRNTQVFHELDEGKLERGQISADPPL